MNLYTSRLYLAILLLVLLFTAQLHNVAPQSSISRFQLNTSSQPVFQIVIADSLPKVYIYPVIWHQPNLPGGDDYSIIFPELTCSHPSSMVAQYRQDPVGFFPSYVELDISAASLPSFLQCDIVQTVGPDIKGMAMYVYSAPLTPTAAFRGDPTILASFTTAPALNRAVSDL